MNEFHQAMDSLLGVVFLNHEHIDELIDEAIECMTLTAEVADFPEEVLAAIVRRVEAIREVVKNNPLPDCQASCKQPVH
jgi:hypothetical protein|nr:MAG TPA: hypothetical protein [Caudoviricetes sp.]